MNNRILSISLLVARIILIMDVILALILVLFGISWAFQLSFMETLHIADNGLIFKFDTNSSHGGVPIASYSDGQFYFLILKSLAGTAILFFILSTSIRVIKSIASLEAFKKDNVHSFRKMGSLFLLWMLLSLPSFKLVDEVVRVQVHLAGNFVIWALICFVLAEIFKEGNRLHEENQLTV